MFQSDDNPFLADRNRRRHRRRHTRIRAWADPGGAAPVVDCVVLDLSDAGANVMSVGAAELPSTFELQVDMRNTMGEAEVVWRDGATVGVRLEKPQGP